LVKAERGRTPDEGQRLVEGLRGRGDFKMTTDEIVTLMRGLRRTRAERNAMILVDST